MSYWLTNSGDAVAESSAVPTLHPFSVTIFNRRLKRGKTRTHPLSLNHHRNRAVLLICLKSDEIGLVEQSPSSVSEQAKFI